MGDICQCKDGGITRWEVTLQAVLQLLQIPCGKFLASACGACAVRRRDAHFAPCFGIHRTLRCVQAHTLSPIVCHANGHRAHKLLSLLDQSLLMQPQQTQHTQSQDDQCHKGFQQRNAKRRFGWHIQLLHVSPDCQRKRLALLMHNTWAILSEDCFDLITQRSPTVPRSPR